MLSIMCVSLGRGPFTSQAMCEQNWRYGEDSAGGTQVGAADARRRKNRAPPVGEASGPAKRKRRSATVGRERATAGTAGVRRGAGGINMVAVDDDETTISYQYNQYCTSVI